MSDSNSRVGIDFQVDASQLKEFTTAINTLERFNRQASQVTNALGSMSSRMDKSIKSTHSQANEYINLDRAMNAWHSRLKNNQSIMQSQEAAQAKLTEKLKQYGRDVKVSVDQTGKLSASFKNAEGNIVSMTGKYDAATNSIAEMKTKLSTAANEVKAKAEADRKAIQEMDRLHGSALKMNKAMDDQKRKYQELTRGTDISRVVKANAGSFDVMTNAVKRNGEIIRGSIDRNGKFSQTLRMQDGTLRSVTGYYDKVNKKLIQYNETVSKSEQTTKRVSAANAKYSKDLTNLEKSMQGLNKYTLSWADAIEIAATRMAQWNVAGTLIFGIQRAFKDLISTLFVIDDQMTQLFRVLPEETNFTEMWEDSIRLSTIYGRTLTDINEGLITFARSGFNNIDTRFLTEAATLMANVSDIDIGDASETLTSALTLFNIKARDSIQVVNKLNEVDNDYAISTEQLAKSITRAGGTAASFGVDLNELIGHTTAIGVATRESGQIIGNSLKSIYSRVNTLPKAQAAIEQLGIALTLPNGDNRDVADIMDDIAKKWPELNNAQKQNTAINVAGTYQLNRFLALMNNYRMGLDATKTAQHSYNSAVKENEKFMQSLNARLNLMKSAFQQLAMALGEAGLYKAIIVVLEAFINFGQGVTKIVDTLGAFTFAIPAAAAALGMFVAQYQKTRLEIAAFQATMLGMNTSLSRQALMMSTTATSSTILSSAFTTLRTTAIGLTAALLTNPLTWITVAITAIPMLVGHFQRLKAEQEALHKKAEDTTSAFKDFKKEIAAGDVSQTSLDVFVAKTDIAGKALNRLEASQKKAKDAQESANSALTTMNATYAYGGTRIQNYTNWQDTLSKKTKEELADIGIKYDKYKSIEDLMAAVKKRQGEYSDAVSAGNGVLEEASKKLMFHADAFEEVGEKVEETMDIMKLFFGVNDQMIQELIDSYNAIMVLTQVKNKDAAQTEALEQAYAVWETRLGLSREELMKNPSAMQENIKWQQQMKEKWGETTQGILTNEEQKQLAVDISKQKVIDSAAKQSEAEQAAAKKKAEAAEEEARRKGKAFDDFMQKMKINEILNNNVTSKEVSNSVLRGDSNQKSANKSIFAWKSEDKQTVTSTTAYQKFKNLQMEANKSRGKSTSSASETVKKNLENERKKSETTGKGFKDMAAKASEANKKVSSTTKSSADSSTKDLDRTNKKVSTLKEMWQKLKEMFKSPLKAVAKFSIKGIIDWFGGQGGGTDPMQALGGSIKGAGYNGLTMTSGFGMRRDPFTGVGRMHNGVDFAGPVGTAIRANTGGQVIYSGFGQYGSGYGGYGNVVAIRDSSGLTHLYAHNSANYVRTGSMVKAGQTIAALGSTGNSTGPHSHYEVRSGARAINPLPFVGRGGGTDPLKDLTKFHSGGIVKGGGYQPPSKTRRSNEVDVRVLKGEMILTKQQQSQLFDMAGLGAPKHKYHTGGIAGGSSWRNAGSFKGMGGGTSTYKVKSGDTLSELAVQFKTTVKNLMSMNKSIKNANKIYAGAKIIVPAIKKAAASIKKPAKPKYTKEKSDELVSSNKSYMDYVQGLGLQNNTTYTTWKLRDKRDYYVNASTSNQRDYNNQYAEALKGYTNLSQAKTAFNSAGFFGLDKNYKDKLWKEIEKSVKANIMASNDKKVDNMFDYVNYMQAMGAKNYDTPQYMTWKLKANQTTFKNAGVESQKQYNIEMAKALNLYDNLNEAKKVFNSAAWFGLNKDQKNSVWKGIEEAVKNNAIEKLSNSTKDWLDTFNNGLTEASKKVTNWLSLIDQIKNQQEDMKRDKYIDTTVAAGMSKFGFTKDLTEEERIQKRMEEIRAEAEERLNQNAQIQYDNNPKELQKRLDEINKKRTSVNNQIKKVTDDAKKRGLGAADQAKILEPLKEALAELDKEYNDINNSSKDATNITKGNQDAVAKLSDEYAKLEAQLNSMTTEKMDEFGNVVRNLSGEIATGAAIAKAATASIASSVVRTVSTPMIAGTPVTYSEASKTQETSSEPKTYSVGATEKNVTYVIQVGTAIGSESELREFAQMLKNLVDEEEGRSES